MSPRRLFACLVGIALAAPHTSLTADDFSVERLRLGEEALRANRTPEAVDQLRIACFGLLDQVEVLSECLVNLALARNASRQPNDVDATLNRFLEVEKRFAPYAKASLPQGTRREFEALLLARVPVDAVLAIPSLTAVALRQCRGVLEGLSKLPSEEWTRRPDLFADLFICQVETKDWKAAAGSWPKVPEELRKRADVERAARTLAAETGRPLR